jgi:hypothetical protein
MARRERPWWWRVTIWCKSSSRVVQGMGRLSGDVGDGAAEGREERGESG